MEATYTHTLVAAQPRLSRSALRGRAMVALRALTHALVEGARGNELDRLFTTSSSAQFSALSRGQQSRLLDRGFRP